MRRRVGARISGLVVEYVVAIDVTRVRFPADAGPPFGATRRFVRRQAPRLGGRCVRVVKELD